MQPTPLKKSQSKRKAKSVSKVPGSIKPYVPPAVPYVNPPSDLPPKVKATKPTAVPPVTVQAATTPPDDADTSKNEPKQLLDALKVYFDLRDGSYLSLLNGRYVCMKKNDLAMRFRAMGLRDDLYVKTKTQGSLREIDYPFYQAQNERMIDFSGAVAGRRVGEFVDGAGKRYLVTDEAKGVWEPLIKDSKPVFFPAFVTELLGDEQAGYFFYWLAIAVRSMRAQDFGAGQALILAGEPRCGKSLLQLFITEILGGRSADPFKYLMGENFNKDLSVAEHWMVEDPGTSTDIRTRREFGEKIKEATVNRDIRINGKGKDAGKVQIFRRVTISVNSEKESLAVCPPMVEGVKDKIMLFLCDPVSKAFDRFRDKHGIFNKAEIWKFFMGELHAIRSWLLKTYSRVPTALTEERMGIRAYHHAEILAELSSMTYESRFLELIDEKFFTDDDKDAVFNVREMKAADWQKALLDHNRFESEKVLRYPGQCGSHFGKLLKSEPQRISKRVEHGYTFWTVKPPVKGQNQ